MTAWTTVVALLFHVTILLAPTFTHAADGLGNTIILCSSFGQHSVPLAALDGDQVPDQLPEKNSAPACSVFCSVCAAAQLIGPAIPTAETILPPPNGPTTLIQFASVVRDASGLRALGSGPRAPPSIV